MKRILFGTTPLTLIDTIGHLNDAQKVLLERKTQIDDGVRFDHVDGGHDAFVGTVLKSLDEVNVKISKLG